MKKNRIYLWRNGRVVDVIKEISYLELSYYCLKNNLKLFRKGSTLFIDVSTSPFRCGKCLCEIDHEHKPNNIDYLKQDIELIKQVINLPKQIISTCLVKNKGDLVKTIEQLQARGYEKPKEPVRKSARIANRQIKIEK